MIDSEATALLALNGGSSGLKQSLAVKPARSALKLALPDHLELLLRAFIKTLLSIFYSHVFSPQLYFQYLNKNVFFTWTDPFIVTGKAQ